MLTEDCASAFLLSKASAGRKPKTLETYGFVLRRFGARYAELPDTPEPIEAFLAAISGEPETVDVYYRTLNTFYGWVQKRRGIDSPMRFVERPKLLAKVPSMLDLSNLYRALEYPVHSDRDRALLYFLADSGWRIGEAHNLRHSMIQEGYIVADGKTGQRMTPLSARVRAMLSALPRHPFHLDVVWWGLKGPLSKSGMEQAVRKALRRAGFSGHRMSAHALRHSFATLWEGDELVLQQILGHQTLTMVKRYRQYRIARAQAQHALYSPLALLRERQAPQLALMNWGD